MKTSFFEADEFTGRKGEHHLTIESGLPLGEGRRGLAGSVWRPLPDADYLGSRGRCGRRHRHARAARSAALGCPQTFLGRPFAVASARRPTESAAMRRSMKGEKWLAYRSRTSRRRQSLPVTCVRQASAPQRHVRRCTPLWRRFAVARLLRFAARSRYSPLHDDVLASLEEAVVEGQLLSRGDGSAGDERYRVSKPEVRIAGVVQVAVRRFGAPAGEAR